MTQPTKNQTSKRKLIPQYHVKYVKVPKLRIFKKLINMIQPTKKAKIKQAKESFFLSSISSKIRQSAQLEDLRETP